jgi:quinolinate synthase
MTELDRYIDMVQKIKSLKKERKAIILAHLYQPDEIQEIADFTGDSFGLSQKAAQTDAEVIVFCGVRFMAETANILSPDKITLLPAENAGCRMFDDTLSSQLKNLLAQKPEALVVSYVNTPADVKAMSDICCTSANAVAVVESLPKTREIIFVPDRNLGSYVEEQSGRKMYCWQGACPTHDNLTLAELETCRQKHPKAVVLMHPECTAELRDAADYVGSTTGILKYAKASSKDEFIVATECGVLYKLQEDCPNKKFYLASPSLVCSNMKKTTLEKVYKSLLNLEPRVIVEESIRKKAVAGLNRMLEIC